MALRPTASSAVRVLGPRARRVSAYRHTYRTYIVYRTHRTDIPYRTYRIVLYVLYERYGIYHTVCTVQHVWTVCMDGIMYGMYVRYYAQYLCTVCMHGMYVWYLSRASTSVKQVWHVCTVSMFATYT